MRLFITSAAVIALTIPAAAVVDSNSPRHRWLPPVEYDHPYNGELNIVRHETNSDVQAACPSVPNPLACARVSSPTKCEIHLSPDYMYDRYLATPDVIMRHEIGHCNGWVHAPDYNGTENAAAKPPVPASKPVPVQAIEDDAAAAEERKTHTIATTYKRCLATRSTQNWKATYTQEEINNYCGCFSVTINERVTEKEWKEAVAAGTWNQHPKLIEAASYCTKKYYNLPDVTEIRKKKW